MSDQMFDDAIKRMDAANAKDPNAIEVDGANEPFELVYARRMSQTLLDLYPDASKELQLAARAQHIERWSVPRDTYPMDRAGYHRWRNDLKKRHAQTASKILSDSGYTPDTVDKVASLIAKKDLKTDPQAQALEDVACIVFFEHYAAAFAAKHPPEKVATIVTKTWNKMSPHAHDHVLTLDIPADLKSQLRALAKNA